jgi:hypothetical protein
MNTLTTARTIVLAFSLIALAAPTEAAQRTKARDNGAVLEQKCHELVGKEEREGEGRSHIGHGGVGVRRQEQLGAIMRPTALKYAMSVGLGGMLALGAATGFGQVGTGTVAASQVTQYCLPPRDNPDAQRFYCGNEDDSADQAGAAFRVLHAGGRGKSFAA